jgi:hypothetical protein
MKTNRHGDDSCNLYSGRCREVGRQKDHKFEGSIARLSQNKYKKRPPSKKEKKKNQKTRPEI